MKLEQMRLEWKEHKIVFTQYAGHRVLALASVHEVLVILENS